MTKKSKLIYLLAMTTGVAAILFSCSKEIEKVEKTQNSVTDVNESRQVMQSAFEREYIGDFIPVELDIEFPGLIAASFHRGIEKRRRDNKTCDCGACFGICDIRIDMEPDFPINNGKEDDTNIMLTLISNGGESKILIEVLEPIDEPEPLAIVDYPIITDFISPNGDLVKLTIEPGSYNYTEFPQPTPIGLKTKVYGAVIVDGSIIVD